MLGADLTFLAVNFDVVADKYREAVSLITVIVINFLIGVGYGMDNWASFGGLFTGMCLGGLMLPHCYLRDHVPTNKQIRIGSAIALFSFFLIPALILILRTP